MCDFGFGDLRLCTGRGIRLKGGWKGVEYQASSIFMELLRGSRVRFERLSVSDQCSFQHGAGHVHEGRILRKADQEQTE